MNETDAHDPTAAGNPASRKWFTLRGLISGLVIGTLAALIIEWNPFGWFS